MNLVRRDPFSDLRATMDHLFESGLSRPWRFLPPGHESDFAVEVSQTDKEIEVKAALPGVKPEDVSISVQDGILSIEAEHKEDTKEEKKDYYHRELRYGAYRRAFALPTGVDVDKASATFENGILHLVLPKVQVVKPKQIKVNHGPAASRAPKVSTKAAKTADPSPGS